MPRQDDSIKCLGKGKFLKAGFRLLGEYSFQDALTFVALRDSWTGPITMPYAAHVIPFLENELKPLEIFNEPVVLRKENGPNNADTGN